MHIYPFHLKILDFRYRFLCLRNFKKFAIGLAITHFLKFRRHKNQVAKKPVSSGGMGIFYRHLIPIILVGLINSANATDLKQIEQKISDAVITTKIKTKIAKSETLNPLKISVSTKNGEVTLSGHAKNKQAFVDTLRIATSTQGVKSVNTSNLDIKHVNSALVDAYITTKVEAAVLEAKVIDDESIPIVGINATTVNGTVTITGDIKSSKSIAAILKRVNRIKWVKKVISNLEITK